MGKKFIEEEKRACESVFIAVGEMEGFMVDDSCKVVEILKAQQYPVEFYIAPHENHASIVPTVMSRALRFVFSKFD